MVCLLLVHIGPTFPGVCYAYIAQKHQSLGLKVFVSDSRHQSIGFKSVVGDMSKHQLPARCHKDFFVMGIRCLFCEMGDVLYLSLNHPPDRLLYIYEMMVQ